MVDIQQLINTGSVGVQVQAITGKPEDSVYAAGYAAWIAAITGKAPAVQKVAVGRVKMALTEDQKVAMRQWLSGQTQGLFQISEPPTVDYSAGDYLTPWAVQYAAPLVIGAFVAGWVAHWFINRK